MAYEVVKEIRGHRYRYSVESHRDPDTGKVKNKWTYVGRVTDGAKPSPKRRTSGDETRETIVQAFLKLIASKKLKDVTPAAIARAAGITPATFYRHFRSRDDVVMLCTQRANKELEERLTQLRAIAPSVPEERARIREFAIDLVRKPPAPPALFRTWSALLPETVREARNRQRIEAFSAYIGALQARGHIGGERHRRRMAIALSMIVQTFTRRSYVENTLLSEEDYAVVGDVFERLIFATLSSCQEADGS